MDNILTFLSSLTDVQGFTEGLAAVIAGAIVWALGKIKGNKDEKLALRVAEKVAEKLSDENTDN